VNQLRKEILSGLLIDVFLEARMGQRRAKKLGGALPPRMATQPARAASEDCGRAQIVITLGATSSWLTPTSQARQPQRRPEAAERAVLEPQRAAVDRGEIDDDREA
jgi:hypothetical protein